MPAATPALSLSLSLSVFSPSYLTPLQHLLGRPPPSPDPLRSITSPCPPLFSPVTSPSKVLPHSPAILNTSLPSPGSSHLLRAPFSVFHLSSKLSPPRQLLLTPPPPPAHTHTDTHTTTTTQPCLRSSQFNQIHPPSSSQVFSSILSSILLQTRRAPLQPPLLPCAWRSIPSLHTSHPLPLFKSISSHSPCLASSFRLQPPSASPPPPPSFPHGVNLEKGYHRCSIV